MHPLPPPRPCAIRWPTPPAACLLGALGVLIFAATLPMTRLAVGDTARRSCRRPSSPPAAPRGRAAQRGLAADAACAGRATACGGRCSSARWARWSAFRCSWRWRCAGRRDARGRGHRRAAAGHRGGGGAGGLRQRASAGFWACAWPAARWCSAFAAWQGGGVPGSPADGCCCWRCCAAPSATWPARGAGGAAGAAGDLLGAGAVAAADAAGHLLAAGPRQPASARPGPGLPTGRCSRCGWASLPGTAGWRWAA
jgi:xanthosine utilization system XapX-like protein